MAGTCTDGEGKEFYQELGGVGTGIDLSNSTATSCTSVLGPIYNETRVTAFTFESDVCAGAGSESRTLSTSYGAGEGSCVGVVIEDEPEDDYVYTQSLATTSVGPTFEQVSIGNEQEIEVKDGVEGSEGHIVVCASGPCRVVEYPPPI